jgi:hypothetical protein
MQQPPCDQIIDQAASPKMPIRTKEPSHQPAPRFAPLVRARITKRNHPEER